MFELNKDQFRKGSDVSYLGHLLGAASLVIEYGGNEDEAIGALLHDAIEDQGGAKTGKEIKKRFGKKVYEIVLGCTDTDQIPKPPWKERKKAYLNHSCNASPSVLLVSSADKLYNAQTILRDYRQIGEKLWDRFTGGKEGTLWYYQALVDAFKESGTNPIVEELERTVKTLRELIRK